MGWCVHTDAPIPKDTCLVSCSIGIAITPRKSRDQIAKLLARSALPEAGNRGRMDDADVYGSEKLQLPKLQGDNALSSWLDHQIMCLYLMLTRLSIQLSSIPASQESRLEPSISLTSCPHVTKIFIESLRNFKQGSQWTTLKVSFATCFLHTCIMSAHYRPTRT